MMDERPLSSSFELVLGAHTALMGPCIANPPSLEAAVAAMAPATKAAILSDYNLCRVSSKLGYVSAMTIEKNCLANQMRLTS
ncbi:MAG: hypothetical protein KGQ42_00500 [Alphaproteobacteria bacterium]|nr:hypothetical protein [Alphaproteobacteria bacterium]MDE2041937.1 hypothetical protein [Alphaproteobacteria bacterium]MDE2341202.1 hypothetical protein [Alphaproteobacteria bacterium]